MTNSVTNTFAEVKQVMENNIKYPDIFFDIYYAWYVKTMEIWFDLRSLEINQNTQRERIDRLEEIIYGGYV